MTRTQAREIAVQICFNMSFEGVGAKEAVDSFFEREHYETLSDVDELYCNAPDEEHLAYIRRLAEGVAEHRDMLDAGIEKHSKFWKVNRISRIAASIMRVCMYEVLFMDDVPDSAAINEAVEMAKRYEEPETVVFINGVLGGFYRGEVGRDKS